jgi:hypothetical protein
LHRIDMKIDSDRVKRGVSNGPHRSADTGSYQIEQSELARYLDAVAVIRAESGAPAQAATPPATPAAWRSKRRSKACARSVIYCGRSWQTSGTIGTAGGIKQKRPAS